MFRCQFWSMTPENVARSYPRSLAVSAATDRCLPCRLRRRSASGGELCRRWSVTAHLLLSVPHEGDRLGADYRGGLQGPARALRRREAGDVPALRAEVRRAVDHRWCHTGGAAQRGRRKVNWWGTAARCCVVIQYTCVTLLVVLAVGIGITIERLVPKWFARWRAAERNAGHHGN